MSDTSAPPALTSDGPAAAGLLARLDDDQRRAVTEPHTPLCVIAGAGSGKTRVLTGRIAYHANSGAIDARHVLAITFTRKAALELGTRLKALGLRDRVASGTFHSVAYSLLRRHWQDRGVAAPALLDRKAPLISRLMPRGDTNVLDVISEIEWAKARLVSPADYEEAARAADRRPPLTGSAIASIYAAYEKEKRKRRVVDFDDLLSLCQKAFETDRDFAAAQRWRARHFFVDEFQDVNPSQFALLRTWMGTGGDICVVGDPRQAIYSWNGADSQYLNGFAEHFPGAVTVELTHNYRSTPQIVKVAHSVLSREWTARPPSTHRPEGPEPTIVSFDDDTAEARGIARRVRDAHNGELRWSDQAVLVRTNAQLPIIEEALSKLKVPFRTRGGGLLRLPEARALVRRIARSQQPLMTAIEGLTAIERSRDVDIDLTDNTDDAPATDTNAAITDAIVRLALDFADSEPTATGATFAAWLESAGSQERVDPDTDAVDLATFHAAKGLEWKVVYVAGCEQGLMPIGHAKTIDAQAEEQRLAYVALSRAEDRLVCTWARERRFGARVGKRSASPYLERIGTALSADQLALAAIDKRAKVAALRGSLGSKANDASAVDDALFGALKSWRASVARASNVPPYVVFSDATLRDISSAKPQSRAALSRISGIGPVKLDRYADAVLAIVTGK